MRRTWVKVMQNAVASLGYWPTFVACLLFISCCGGGRLKPEPEPDKTIRTAKGDMETVATFLELYCREKGSVPRSMRELVDHRSISFKTSDSDQSYSLMLVDLTEVRIADGACTGAISLEPGDASLPVLKLDLSKREFVSVE